MTLSTEENIQSKQSELESLAMVALQVAKKSGASDAEVSLHMGQGLSVTVRQGEIETIEHNQDNSVGVTVYFGHRLGSASTTDLNEQAIEQTVTAACTIAKNTAEDRCFGLADPERLAHDILDLDLYQANTISVAEAIDSARNCEAQALAQDRRISNSEGAEVSLQEGKNVYANSNGFIHGQERSRYSRNCSVIAQDASGMQRDYWYDSRRYYSDLENDRSVGEKAAQRTLRRLGARKLTTQKAPIVFEAPVAAGLISHFLSAISGGNLYRQSTFLLDSMGQMIFPKWLSIYERPCIPRGLGSAPYDNEGVKTKDRNLVLDGELQGYLLSSYSARKLGMQTTGNAGGAHNIIVPHSDTDITGLLQEMGTGLMVSELIGFGINSVTGDYSRGAAGFWVEQGEIQFPVDEITIAGNLRTMYQQIAGIADDIDSRGDIQCGSILLENMTIAGN